MEITKRKIIVSLYCLLLFFLLSSQDKTQIDQIEETISWILPRPAYEVDKYGSISMKFANIKQLPQFNRLEKIGIADDELIHIGLNQVYQKRWEKTEEVWKKATACVRDELQFLTSNTELIANKENIIDMLTQKAKDLVSLFKKTELWVHSTIDIQTLESEEFNLLELQVIGRSQIEVTPSSLRNESDSNSSEFLNELRKTKPIIRSENASEAKDGDATPDFSKVGALQSQTKRSESQKGYQGNASKLEENPWGNKTNDSNKTQPDKAHDSGDISSQPVIDIPIPPLTPFIKPKTNPPSLPPVDGTTYSNTDTQEFNTSVSTPTTTPNANTSATSNSGYWNDFINKVNGQFSNINSKPNPSTLDIQAASQLLNDIKAAYNQLKNEPNLDPQTKAYILQNLDILIREIEKYIGQGAANLPKSGTVSAEVIVEPGNKYAAVDNPSCEGGVAKCKWIVVLLPPNSQVKKIRMYAKEYSGGNWSQCQPNTNCIGWCRFDGNYKVEKSGQATKVSQLFKNWSHDRTRYAKIEVDYGQ